ncbi:unnamed protein product, partial [marine sediment metagenome]
MRPDKLIEQQTSGADDYQDKGGYLKKVAHFNVDYNMTWQIVPFGTYIFLLVWLNVTSPLALLLGN